MSAGSDIAAKVAAGLARAGQATGDGTFVCCLEKPVDDAGEPKVPWNVEGNLLSDGIKSDVIALKGSKQLKDSSGTFIGEIVTTLIIAATAVVPAKNDRIAIGVATVDVDANTIWSEIEKVNTLEPGGIALMYNVDLVS